MKIKDIIEVLDERSVLLVCLDNDKDIMLLMDGNYVMIPGVQKQEIYELKVIGLKIKQNKLMVMCEYPQIWKLIEKKHNLINSMIKEIE